MVDHYHFILQLSKKKEGTNSGENVFIEKRYRQIVRT